MKKLFIVLLGIFLLFTGVVFAAEDTASFEDESGATSQEARALYAQNEIDKALKLLTTIGEEYRTSEDWLLIGNILQDKDKLDEAVYMYKKAIEKEPKYYKAHYNLGYIYLIQEKPNMALDEFKKSVKYKDDFAYGYYNMGCANLRLKQYRTARFNFFRAMDLKADEPMIYYNLAYTFQKLNNEKQAQKYLDLYNKIMEKQ